MRRKQSPRKPDSSIFTSPTEAPAAEELLRRLGNAAIPLLPSGPERRTDTSSADELTTASLQPVEEKLNPVIGCKTSDVALAIVVQVMQLEHPDRSTSKERESAWRSHDSAAVRGENTPSDGVSRSGDEERTVPVARWLEHGTAHA